MTVQKITSAPTPNEMISTINAIIDDKLGKDEKASSASSADSAATLSSTLPINKGGTNATTAANARTNLGLNDAIVGLSISGKTITYTQADGGTGTITTQDNGYHTGNATSIGGASATKPAVVVESYRSGNTWYRKYSDGWIEQGGTFTGHSRADTVYTYNFAKAFASSNATVMLQTGTVGHYGYGYELVLNSVTTTQFKVQFAAEGDTTVGTCKYYACGY